MSVSHTHYYRQVRSKHKQQLFTFREQYPPQHTPVGDTSWEYIDTGAGDSVVLLLVGGLRVADASFQTTAPLAKTQRVIAPSYPAYDTMADLADGLVGVLDAAGVGHCAILAGSFGGMLAQVFVRRHPHRVHKLILSSTGMPDVESYRQQMKVLEMTPGVLARRMMPARMLQIMDVLPEQRDFWQAYLNELFHERLSKEEVLSTYRCMIDFAGYQLSSDDLADWDGEVLLIQASDDKTFDAAERDEIANLYPHARRHVFESAGHSPSMTQREAYLALINEFLASH